MAQNEEILRKAQGKIETTRGTGVTVDRKIYETVRLTEAYEPLEFTEATGSFDAWRTFLNGPVTVAGTVEGPATYEDLPWWLEHGVKGGVTATGDEDLVAEAFTRIYQGSSATDDLASSTIEHGAPSPGCYKSTMVMMPEWSLRADIDGDAAWTLSGSLIGKTFTKETSFTGSIADRTREYIKAAGTKIYIDDTTIGSTQVTAKLISFSLNWSNAVNTKRFMEDEDTISTVIGRGARQITGQIRLEWDSDAEKAKFRAGTKRRIRIVREGSTIHDAVKKKIQIDIPDAYWLTPSEDNRDSNMTLTYGFRAYTSSATGSPARITVINAVSAF